MLTRSVVRVGLLIVGILGVVACRPATETGGTPDTPSELIFGLSGEPDTLDPHATAGTLTFQVTRSLYDTLVEPDRDGTIVPALAREWSVGEDRLTWTFTLRDDVLFHDGSTLDAEDVVASLERLLDPELASPNVFEYETIAAIQAPDEQTVVIRLDRPHAPLLATLASGWSAILPSELIDSGHDFANEPVGTGPFSFAAWTRGASIELERNDSYWQDELPYLERVVFRNVPEQAVMAQALITGELDVADILVEPELSLVQQAASTKIHESDSGLVLVLTINTRRSPLDRLRVRQAINAAIDKQAVMETAYSGGRVIHTFMDAGSPYYVDFSDLYSYDPEFAAAVAAEIEFEDELVLRLPQNFEPHVRAGELYHEMLRQAGFPVRTELVDWATWLEDVFSAAQFDLTVIGHTGTLDPDGRLARYGSGETYDGWVNPVALAAIEEARVVADQSRRAELYAVALEEMARELPFVYVGSPFRTVGLDVNLEGFHMDVQLESYDLRRARFR